MAPRRRSPRRPTKQIISADEAEHDGESYQQHVTHTGAQTALSRQYPSLSPPYQAQIPPPPSVTSSASSNISTLTTVPTYNSALSKKAHAGDPPAKIEHHFDWTNIRWEVIPGHSIPLGSSTGLTSKMWAYGVPTEFQETGHRWWLCTDCHAADMEVTHHFNCDSGSSSVPKHMCNIHKITWNKRGEVSVYREQTTPLLTLDAHDSREQELLNQMALAFDEGQFRRLLVRWIVYENVSFRKVDSESFRD